MRWLKNTTLISFLLFTFMPGGVYARCDVSTGTCEGCTAAEISACVEQMGKSAVGAVRDKLGDKPGIKSHAANPLMRSDTPMKTIDGSKSFDAQMLCPSSNKFLQVFAQPSATGDLGHVIISQDLNMDNTFDYTYTIPFAVSGICANGVISCNAGTWSNCTYFKWAADSTGKASLNPARLTDLGGCYCINRSCGSSLVWNNLAVVLKDLGGGVAGAVQAVDPKYAISNVRVQDTIVSYYGQKSGNCAAEWSGTAGSDLHKYRSNWAALSSDAEAARVSQAADPDSYYSMLTTSLFAQQNPFKERNCPLRRTLSCILNSTRYIETVQNQCPGIEADATCKLREERTDGVFTYRNSNPTGLSPLRTCQNITCQQQSACNNDTLYDTGGVSNSVWGCESQGLGSGQCLPHGQPSKCSSWGCEVTVTTTDSDGKPHTYTYIDESCCASCSAAPPLRAYSQYVIAGNALTVAVDIGVSTEKRGCSRIYYIGVYNQLDNLVAYKTEGEMGCGWASPALVYIPTVSGNYTVKIWMQAVRGYGGSHICRAVVRRLTCPLDETLRCSGTLADSVCAKAQVHTVCPEWWGKERTYFCQTSPHDFSDIQKRVKNIQSTATDNTTSIYYQDLRRDGSGNLLTEDVTVELGARKDYGDCELVCKTKSPAQDTQVTTTGHTGETRATTATHVFTYKVCKENICPLAAGETLEKDCQCINDFGEAASTMQVLRLLERDMICSDGVAKPL